MPSDTGSNLGYFGNSGFRSLSFLAHILGLAATTHCLSRRLLPERFSRKGLKKTSWARICIISMSACAWVFILCSGTLIHGVGFEEPDAVCMASSYLSIVFYSACKFFVYAYLTDRVQVLWSPDVNEGRPQTYIYFTSIISAVVYCIIVTLMIGSPIATINSRGVCEIGLKPLGSIPLLVFHVYVNIFVTFLFLFPLVNWTLLNSNLKQLAYRLALAAFIAFSTSTVNILVLILSDGREEGWISLTVGVADVLINIVSMFWASSSDEPKPAVPERDKRTQASSRTRSPSLASVGSNRPSARGSRRLSQGSSHISNASNTYRPDSLHRLAQQQRPLDEAELSVPAIPQPPPRVRRQGAAAAAASGGPGGGGPHRPRSSSRPASLHRHSRPGSGANVQDVMMVRTGRPSSLSTSITAIA